METSILFRQATLEETETIWTILKEAIARRKADGSNQWQDGYPNQQSVIHDINKGVGYVLVTDKTIVGYAAVIFNDEPAYAAIKGKWLTERDFIVYHRVAVASHALGQGYARQLIASIHDLAISKGILSVRADTNFDNKPMLALFEKMGYTYCGEVEFRGSPRKAFEWIPDTD